VGYQAREEGLEGQEAPCRITSQSNGPASPAAVYYNRGYQKADAYLEMSEELRRAYVTGVFDGFMGATFIGGDFRIVQSLVICFEGVITGELFDLVELYLRQHPEMKRYSMNAIMRNVVDRECFQ